LPAISRGGGDPVRYHPRVDPLVPEERPLSTAAGAPSGGAALLFFGVLVALAIFDALAQRANPVLGLAWSQVFTVLVPTLVATAGANLRAGRYLGLARVEPLALGLGLLLGFVGYFPAAALGGLWLRVLPRDLVERFPDVSRLFEGTGPMQVTMTVIAIGLAPVCEEIAYRGYLQRTLARALGPGLAIGLGALLFSARHLDPLRFAPILFLGVLFGWLSWRAGSLWPSIAAHAANNAVASAFALTGAAESSATAAPPGLGALLAILVAGGAIVVALAYAYRRATPAPPRPEAYAEPRDPLLPSGPFLPGLVPAAIHLLALVGIVALALLLEGAG